MLARILIKRKFRKDQPDKIVDLLNEIRSAAMRQPGYVSGETLIDYEEPHDISVLCTWQSIQDWIKWKDSPERKQYEAMLEVFQVGPTKYEEYMVGTHYRPQ